MKLVAVVLTKNSESILKQCLTSLSFADEILVIDDMSTDHTRELAESCGAKVITRVMNGDFGAQRRFAIDASNGEWILFIDSDEIVTPELAKEIRSAVKQPEKRAYEVRRKNQFQYHQISHGSMRSDAVLRLYPKEGLVVEGRVHERVISPYPISQLHNPMLHYPYKDWSAMIGKLDTYTEYLAKQQLEKNKKTNFFSGALLKPTWAFIKVYLINRGFLDGKMGLMFAVHHAYYTFMKYAKYYLMVNSQGKF